MTQFKQTASMVLCALMVMNAALVIDATRISAQVAQAQSMSPAELAAVDQLAGIMAANKGDLAALQAAVQAFIAANPQFVGLVGVAASQAGLSSSQMAAASQGASQGAQQAAANGGGDDGGAPGAPAPTLSVGSSGGGSGGGTVSGS